MSSRIEQKLVSRSDLFQQVPEPNADTTCYNETANDIPSFEFIEVNNTHEDVKEDTENIENEEFEFFPLFATDELTKVDLTEEIIVEIKQERPKEFYFANYSDAQKSQFKDMAISYDDLLKMTQIPYHRYRERIIDLTKHNQKIDDIQSREKKLKKRKPGKNQRLAKKNALENIRKREQLRLSLKKKLRKRGGKKNKKKTDNPLAEAGANLS